MRQTANGPAIYRGDEPLGLEWKQVSLAWIVLIPILLFGVSIDGHAQTVEPLDLNGKLRFHAERSFGTIAVGGSGLRAGFLQLTDSPSEWGQGASGYGKRVSSSMASNGIRGVLAFGLDSMLHQDPRYYPSLSTRFWQRAKHSLRGTVLTRTDAGRETVSTWRLGSAYGAAFVSNQWHPDRFHTVRHGVTGGSIRLGFDLVNNMAAEFWPDVKRKLLRRATGSQAMRGDR